MDKTRIAQSFGSAANSYDEAAYLQRQVGEHLLSCLPEELVFPMLDLGSGTGAFTQALSDLSSGKLISMDLSQAMNQFAKDRCTSNNQGWITGDAENIPLANSCIGQVFASFSLQWCQNLPKLAHELYRILKPGGQAAIATLGTGTLFELKNAWAEVDELQHVNEFQVFPQWQMALKQAGLILEKSQIENKVLRFESVMQLMRELKAIGAHNVNAKARKSLTGKTRIQKLAKAYQPFLTATGDYPATYEVMYLMIKRPE